LGVEPSVLLNLIESIFFSVADGGIAFYYKP